MTTTNTRNIAEQIPIAGKKRKPLLSVSNLGVAFETSRGLVQPVRDVGLTVYPGQTVALVGESGCGKSVTSMSILRLIPSPPGRVVAGSILYQGTDLLSLSERNMRSIRGREIAMIFQEPMTSLNPVFTIGDQIMEAVRLHQGVSSTAARKIAEQSLADVGIASPRQRLDEYPHQMSGGMRQRVMIAMALSCKPKLLIADEPTTALDVTIQAQILDLLRKLQRETGMSILLITHDLGVVAENADVVAVMYASRIVEYATVEDLFDNPRHPYTSGLFRAVPRLGAYAEKLQAIAGTVPNPARFPTGCKFHPRCPRSQELAAKLEASGVSGKTIEAISGGERLRVLSRCAAEEPILRELSPRHWAACHQADGYEGAKATEPDLDHRRLVSGPSGPVEPMGITQVT
jgi:oligopeptide/dipeptide ABC transporter ATP-binding protein